MPRPRLIVLLAVAALMLGPAHASRAQTDPASDSPAAGEGVALVIGNETYTDLPNVAGSTADAAAVAVYLRQIGFEVLQYVNLTQGEMLAASQRFIGKLREGEVGIVYFAGHVLQYKDNNYLVPTNARLDRATSILSSGLPLNTLIRRIEEAEMGSALYFLEGGLAIDPTGDGAFASGMAEPPESAVPSAFALSVAPDMTIAIADPTLGDFTANILAQATRPGVSLRDALAVARDRMAEARGSAAPPWVRDSLDEPFVMAPTEAPLAIEASEQRIWNTIGSEDNDAERLTAINFYLQLYPEGTFAAEARRMQAQLQAAAADTTPSGGDVADTNSTDEVPVGTDESAVEGNQPPQFAAPVAVTLTAGGEAVALDLPAPVDPEGEPLTIEVEALPAAATIARGDTPLAVGDTLSAEELAGLTATPGPDVALEGEPFRLAITDAAGSSLVSTIRVEVIAGENRPPVVVDLAAVEVAANAAPVALAIPAPTDPDGDALTITVTGLPKFGEVLVGEASATAGQEIPLEALATLAYAPNPGQSGDAGALALTVRDAHGNEVSFSQPITVTPAPTEEGAAPWDAAGAGVDDLTMAQRALQALDLYSGSLDGVFGRGSQAAIARYQATLDVEGTGSLTARERAELAVAGAAAQAEAARAVAAQAEEAAAQAQEVAHSEEAVEVSWAAGIYRGQVNGTTLEGYGVLQASNGQSFAGLFENSEPKLGVHLFQSDSRYAGEERGRVPDGLGVYTYPSGVVFAGEWADGQINGLGVSESELGVTVAGEWTDNAPNGYGAVIDGANGRRIGRMDAGRFTAVY
jgi:peptidoglycan hydrolase-like protein with peptidoglycan-binding domain